MERGGQGDIGGIILNYLTGIGNIGEISDRNNRAYKTEGSATGKQIKREGVRVGWGFWEGFSNCAVDRDP